MAVRNRQRMQPRVRVWQRRGVPQSKKCEKIEIQQTNNESDLPEIHELVMMDDAEGLTMYLEYHPGEIELQFRLKTPLLVAIKSNSWNFF